LQRWVGENGASGILEKKKIEASMSFLQHSFDSEFGAVYMAQPLKEFLDDTVRPANQDLKLLFESLKNTGKDRLMKFLRAALRKLFRSRGQAQT
jgi:hypothetical protein